jgi:hypothetical protein
MINKSWQHCLVFGFLLTLGLTASAQAGDAEPGLRITLLVRNYAEVPEKTLRQAEKEMTTIFHQLGIDTSWHHIPAPSGERRSNSSSTPTVPTPGLQLRIHILSQTMARPLEERFANGDHVFGVAPRTEDNPGRLVYIFYHRVEELVQKQWLLEYTDRILGLVIAHEIGHLLLPSNSHTKTGIMRANWYFPSKVDFLLATSGNLGFTPQQAKLIHKVVKRMMEHEGSKGR